MADDYEKNFHFLQQMEFRAKKMAREHRFVPGDHARKALAIQARQVIESLQLVALTFEQLQADEK